VPWFHPVRGQRHRSRQRSNPQLEPTLPNVHHQHEGKRAMAKKKKKKKMEKK
jgi:hypothetical protein